MLRTDVASTVVQFNATVDGLARYVLPIMGLVMLAGVVVNLAQVGILFLPNKLAPDLSRIDPLKGFQRMFSITTAGRLGFGIFKIVVIAAVAFASLYQQRDTILGLTALAIPQIAVFLVGTIIWTSVKVGFALLVLAILDYGFQWWKHEQDLKMTPQEVREEMKNLEGDPQIIAKRRALQRQRAMSRLSDLIPKADVVVTNPTELAVAIQYDPKEMAAPIVLAKGAGVLAARIRRLALENDVPVVERKPLARALFHDVDVRHPIPREQYAAVAEVLAYVYQLKGKTIPTPPVRDEG